LATSSAVATKTPSDFFMMFALCPTVIFFRPFELAYSKANFTIRRVADIEMGLRVIPVSGVRR
jgi:hypothetical protein